MHEVSIVEGLLDHIAQQQKKHSFTKVLLIDIVAGQYNCVSVDNLSFCFKAATEKDPLFEHTRLTVTRLPQHYVCRDCQKEFDLDNASVLSCPSCQSEQITPQISSELYLNKLEVE